MGNSIVYSAKVGNLEFDFKTSKCGKKSVASIEEYTQKLVKFRGLRDLNIEDDVLIQRIKDAWDYIIDHPLDATPLRALFY